VSGSGGEFQFMAMAWIARRFSNSSKTPVFVTMTPARTLPLTLTATTGSRSMRQTNVSPIILFIQEVFVYDTKSGMYLLATGDIAKLI
jgi:hypothetical protein